jgi:hypothetical protein
MPTRDGAQNPNAAMRSKARIVGTMTRLNEANQRVAIPQGDCEIDDGPRGQGPYTLYWKEGGKEVSAALTLAERTLHVVRIPADKDAPGPC